MRMRDSCQPSTYLHMLEGRLRIKILEVKRAPSKASKFEKALAQVEGITYVKANLTTGNVLILFEPEVTDHGEILHALKRLGWLKPNRKSAPSMTDQAVQIIARQILQSAAQLAVERLILAVL